MKTVILAVVLTVIGTFSNCAIAQERAVTNTPDAHSADKRQFVLVELFTSEGCNTCPPADRVLGILQSNSQIVPGADVITLGFHVDYWDDGGWKDRFDSAEYTRRQQAYARQMRIDAPYTPQMVVDGSTEFVGSNAVKATDAITRSAAQPKATLGLKIDSDKLSVNISGLQAHTDATVYLAVAENGLSTKVGGGENTGKALQHSSVVRNLTTIGSIKGRENSLNVEKALPVNKNWKDENLKYVVFVQENKTLKILAVNQTSR